MMDRPDLAALAEEALNENGAGMAFVGGVKNDLTDGSTLIILEGVFSPADLRRVADAIEPRSWWRRISG